MPRWPFFFTLDKISAATHCATKGIFGDMVGVSVTAVLRSHAQILENMAAKVEELARRASEPQEAKSLRQLGRNYRLLSLQHEDWFSRNTEDVRAAEKSA